MQVLLKNLINKVGKRYECPTNTLLNFKNNALPWSGLVNEIEDIHTQVQMF